MHFGENVNGDGSSWFLNPVRTSFAAKTVSAGDLDGDGIQDVIGVSDAALLWWRADGLGGWTENTFPASQVSKDAVAVADLDMDGDQDVVLGSFSDGVDWYENSGHGGSWTEHYVHSGYVWDDDSMVLADVDGDGDLDVATAAYGSVVWIPNDLRDSGFFGSPCHRER